MRSNHKNEDRPLMDPTLAAGYVAKRYLHEHPELHPCQRNAAVRVLTSLYMAEAIDNPTRARKLRADALYTANISELSYKAYRKYEKSVYPVYEDQPTPSITLDK